MKKINLSIKKLIFKFNSIKKNSNKFNIYSSININQNFHKNPNNQKLKKI